MKFQNAVRNSVLLAGGALALTVTAACQGQSGATGPAGTATGPASATAPASAPATVPGPATGATSGAAGTTGAAAPATTSRSAGPAECKAPQLSLSMNEAGDAAGGSLYPLLVFTNKGGASCVLVGFPGVSLVTGDNGRQVGSPARRQGGIGPQVTLAPGGTASSTVQLGEVGNVPAARCKPVPVRGFRVYPPDDTAAMFVPFHDEDMRACSAALSSVTTVKPGATG